MREIAHSLDRGKRPGNGRRRCLAGAAVCGLTALALAAALASCRGPAGDGEGNAGAATPRRHLAAAARGRNLLLLSIDTLRADHLNAYGYAVRATSPNLDGLLAQGVRFADAAAARALTWPSLASVLTGLYPSAHGVTDNGYQLPDEVITLPEVLHEAGYRTAAFLSNMCDANHQGWDDFACSGGQDGKTVERAIAWVAEHQQDPEPWFVWVHLFGAHGPYYNGGDLAQTELDPSYEGPLRFPGLSTKKWMLDRVMEEPIALAPRDVTYLDALYDAAVIGSDRLAGRLLSGMRDAGALGGDAVTVFLADHGEELYEHNGYVYHACSVYQSTLHVPLGVVAPGLLPGGETVPQTVELIDVLPTVLDLLAIAPPEELHGVSLVPYLDRPGAGGGAGRPAYSEFGATPLRTVHAGRWKLVWNPTRFQPYCVAGAPKDHYPVAQAELYDLRADPHERHDLAHQHPAEVAELARRIDQRFAGLRRRVETQEIPEELEEKLRALGYLTN